MKAARLIEFLRETPSRDLSPAVRLTGWVAVCNALANVQGRVAEARSLFREAVDVARQLPKDSEENRSVHRIDAKLLYLEGRKDAALGLLHDQRDPKAVNLLLRLLVAEDRVEEAGELVRKTKPHLDWSEIALSVLGDVHDVGAAERLHREMTEQCQQAGKLLKAVELDVALSEAYFVHGLRLVGVARGDKVSVTHLSSDAAAAFERSLCLARAAAERQASTGDDQIAVQAVLLCMKCSGFLGDFEGAATYALRLPAEFRAQEEVAGAFINRLIKSSVTRGENK